MAPTPPSVIRGTRHSWGLGCSAMRFFIFRDKREANFSYFGIWRWYCVLYFRGPPVKFWQGLIRIQCENTEKASNRNTRHMNHWQNGHTTHHVRQRQDTCVTNWIIHNSLGPYSKHEQELFIATVQTDTSLTRGWKKPDAAAFTGTVLIWRAHNFRIVHPPCTALR